LLQQQGADEAGEGSSFGKMPTTSGICRVNLGAVLGAGKPDGKRMGLSICQSIIEALGGHIWASLCVPHGTAFWFTVPTATPCGLSFES
jgi:hypothetical protein